MATKLLQGITRITAEGDYIFALPQKPNYTTLPNALDNVVLEEVYIIIEESAGTGPVNIYLPAISDFNEAWNCKIYLVNKIREAFVLVQKVDDPAQLDFINFTNTIQLLTSTTQYLHIVDNHLWAMWETGQQIIP